MTQSCLQGLSEADDAIQLQLGSLGRTLQELVRLDSTASGLAENHSQAVELLSDLQIELSRYQDKVEMDPSRLAEIEERLAVVQNLKRKYGSTISQVLEFGSEAQKKLQALESRDVELIRIQQNLATLESEIQIQGQALTVARTKLLPKLGKYVAQELSALGFRQSKFEVALASIDGSRHEAGLSATGFDSCEFLFSPNPGEPAKALRSIASSGELARVMLALKTVLADQDDVPVLVFDEVDANVGGETAGVVGQKMRQIARRHQILCITHLAPVAAYGHGHVVVSKEVRAGRTESRLDAVEGPERVAEIARMLGGNSAAALRHAEELIALATR